LIYLDNFHKKGGILISTDVSREGTDLKFVDQCINYDLPRSEIAMEMRWARFNRIGREKPFKMLVLKDEYENTDKSQE